MGEDYRKYDSDIDVEARNIRLAKDAQTIGENFVKLTFVGTSRGENDEDMWWECIPVDGQAALAGFLKKGDVLSITGFPTMRRFGDDGEKVGLTLKRARLHVPLDLFMQLKERGFSAAGGGDKAKTGKKPTKGAPRREVQDLDDGDA